MKKIYKILIIILVSLVIVFFLFCLLGSIFLDPEVFLKVSAIIAMFFGGVVAVGLLSLGMYGLLTSSAYVLDIGENSIKKVEGMDSIRQNLVYIIYSIMFGIYPFYFVVERFF